MAIGTVDQWRAQRASELGDQGYLDSLDDRVDQCIREGDVPTETDHWGNPTDGEPTPWQAGSTRRGY